MEHLYMPWHISSAIFNDVRFCQSIFIDNSIVKKYNDKYKRDVYGVCEGLAWRSTIQQFHFIGFIGASNP